MEVQWFIIFQDECLWPYQPKMNMITKLMRKDEYYLITPAHNSSPNKGKRKNVVLIAKTKITDLQNPAMTRNVMKRNKPVQTPARPYVGAATSIKREEINPATT